MAAEVQPSAGGGGLMEALGIKDKLVGAGKGVVKFFYGWIDNIEDPVTRRVAEFAAGILTVGAVFGVWIVVMKWAGGAHQYSPRDALNTLHSAIEDPRYWSQLKPCFYITAAAIAVAGVGLSMSFDALAPGERSDTVSKVQRILVMMLIAGAGFSLFYFPSVGQSWSSALTSNSSMLGLLIMGSAPALAYEL